MSYSQAKRIMDKFLNNNCILNEENSFFYFVSEDEKEKYEIDKSILMTKSLIFQDIINNSDKEVFKNEDGDAIQIMIRYLKTGEIDLVEDNLICIKRTMELAEKYEVTKLKDICVKKISTISLTISNVYSVMKISKELKIKERERECNDFISKNFKDILDTGELKEAPFKEILDILIYLKVNKMISDKEFLCLIFKRFNVNDPWNENYEKLILENMDLTHIPVEDCLKIIQSYAGSSIERNFYYIILKKMFSDMLKYKTFVENMQQQLDQQDVTIAEIHADIENGLSELIFQRNDVFRNYRKIRYLQYFFHMQANKFEGIIEDIDKKIEKTNYICLESTSMIYTDIDRFKDLVEEVQSKMHLLERILGDIERNFVENQKVCREDQRDKMQAEIEKKVDEQHTMIQELQLQQNQMVRIEERSKKEKAEMQQKIKEQNNEIKELQTKQNEMVCREKRRKKEQEEMQKRIKKQNSKIKELQSKQNEMVRREEHNIKKQAEIEKQINEQNEKIKELYTKKNEMRTPYHYDSCRELNSSTYDDKDEDDPDEYPVNKQRVLNMMKMETLKCETNRKVA